MRALDKNSVTSSRGLIYNLSAELRMPFDPEHDGKSKWLCFLKVRDPKWIPGLWIPVFNFVPIHCPSHHEAENVLLAAANFFCLRPGDTDAEYFDNYTKAQVAFRDGDAEEVEYLFEEVLGGH